MLWSQGLQSGQLLFQSVNSLGTAVTGRALNRYNAWTAIRKRAKAAGFLTPVGCHTWRAIGMNFIRRFGMSLNESVVHNESSDRVKWHVPTALCCGLARVAASW
jgi:hypothetical protein